MMRLRSALIFFPLLLTGWLATIDSYAQRPKINSLSTYSAPIGHVITITGENFGTDASDLAIFFGAVKGTIQSITSQVIEVEVPAGAMHDNVSVVNTSNGLIGYSAKRFFPAFGGTSPFTAADLDAEEDFTTKDGIKEMCLCDFDGDGKIDVSTVHDDASVTTISTFRNTSTGAGDINFASAVNTSVLTETLHNACGDLDGDGKPDLVVTESSSSDAQLFIFLNTSTGSGSISFSLKKTYSFDNVIHKRIKIADMDLDGKPEIITTDQGANYLQIYTNASTPGTIDFGTSPTTFTVSTTSAATGMDGLDVVDLDGDKYPEIVASQFISNSSELFFIQNTSSVGNVSLGSVTSITGQKAMSAIRLGDIDGDGSADIVVARLTNFDVQVYLNQSTTGSLSFASAISLTTAQERPSSISLADIDGDGDLDILTNSVTQASLSIFVNTSTSGSLSFNAAEEATISNQSVQAAFGDMDNDGKPDVVVGIYDNTLAVLRNINCLIPEVTPEGPVSVCTGDPVTLTANASDGVTYQWQKDGSNISGATDYTYDATATGDYTVIATSESGTCSETSNSVTVTVGSTSYSGTLTITADPDPACYGNSLELEASTITGASSSDYQWSGPDIADGTTGQTITISSFSSDDVGVYEVQVLDGTCVAMETTITVEGINTESFEVSASGSTVGCEGDTKTLTVSPFYSDAGYTFSWYKDGSDTGDTGETYSATESGAYSVVATTPCGDKTTESVTITLATLPVVSFTIPDEACTGETVTFEDTSSTDADATATYEWTIDGTTTYTTQSPEHTFSAAADYAVNLTVSYDGECEVTGTAKTITVVTAPQPTITNPEGVYSACSGDSVRLEVLDQAGVTYLSYSWNTGASTSYIYVTEAGSYSVDVTTDLEACPDLTAEDVTVTLTSAPAVTISADPSSVEDGETSQLSASGLLDYTWTPAETLSDATIAEPVASPSVSTTYTVTGEGSNGCTGEASVTVEVTGNYAVYNLFPKVFFTPNADASNPKWVVENILEYPTCAVAIYDNKGIKVYESKPYLNDWDGTYNGKALPQGVYYYIIRCDGEENIPKTGSITILR